LVGSVGVGVLERSLFESGKSLFGTKSELAKMSASSVASRPNLRGPTPSTHILAPSGSFAHSRFERCWFPSVVSGQSGGGGGTAPAFDEAGCTNGIPILCCL